MIFEPGNQWDQTLITDLLSKVDVEGLEVCVIPGRYYIDRINEINQQIKDFPSVLIIITGDEEGLFPTNLLNHPNMRIWLQSPHINDPRHADTIFPIGYTPNTRKIGWTRDKKTQRWFFAGQNENRERDKGKTNPCISKRQDLVNELNQYDDGQLIETEGFLQGIDNEEYIRLMNMSFTAPCPSGTVIPDTFRLYEALELGCVPIVQGRDQQGNSEGYYEYLLDENPPPFPIISDWKELRDTINYFCDTYPYDHNMIFSWWQKYKRKLKQQLQTHINQLTGKETSGITVLMPTSPIKSHPDTTIIEKTIESVKERLPDAEILILIDGIRPEQEQYRENYNEYIRRLLHYTNYQDNVVPICFNEHNHQFRMTKHALTLVNTPNILFVEHDTPLEGTIPFDLLQTCIGEYDVIRFHHESEILPEHQHLMVSDTCTDESPILKTAQWSQRPHLASTDYYRRLLSLIHEDSKTMIEDAVHGITQAKFLRRGYPGWTEHRIGIYAPDGNIRRSGHLDGREDDPKFDMEIL